MTAARRRPRVLLVGNFLSATRGIRCACEDLAEHLEAAGWEIVTASDKPARVQRFLDMTATPLLRRAQYDVAQVDVFSGPSFVWAEAVTGVLRTLEKPYVLTLRGGNLPRMASKSPARVRRLLNTARAVTTPSTFLREAMQRYRSDLTVLRNGIELQDYTFKERTEPAQRLVWLRAFHEIYNPTLVPRVLSALLPDFPDLTVMMIGPDKGDGSLDATKRLADKLGVAERIRIMGPVAKREVPTLLQEGDVFFNSTNVDNAPVTVVEAMACGLCVVSTDVDGIPFLVEDGKEALLVPADDPAAAADAVRRILCEPDLSLLLSRSARRKAEAFAWTTVLPQWEELLTQAAA